MKTPKSKILNFLAMSRTVMYLILGVWTSKPLNTHAGAKLHAFDSGV